MVSTLDFESSDPSSNLGGTSFHIVGSILQQLIAIGFATHSTNIAEYLWLQGSVDNNYSCSATSWKKIAGRHGFIRAARLAQSVEHETLKGVHGV